MPYIRPSLAEIEADLQADMQSRLPGTDPRLRRSYLGAIARAAAGGLFGLYGFLAWIARSAFPDTAEDEELVHWAAIYGLKPVDAVKASGSIAVTGVDGTVVDEGTVWRSGAGIDYESTAEVVLAGGGTIPVKAVKAGAAGNAAAGVKMSTVSPVPGLISEAVVSSSLTTGADAESNESLQRRVVDRIQNPPRGGAHGDYRQWARAAHGDVSRVWPRRNTPELGQVTVYFMTDEATATGIPEAAVVALLQAAINLERPVTAEVIVAAPVGVPLDVTVGDVAPDNAQVRAAIEAEISDLVRRESEPGGTILVSHIREAISTAAGETDHELTAPVADVAHAANQIAVPGAVTFS